MNAATDAWRAPVRALRVVHLRGCDFDEDMWDRVVGLWRLNADPPAASFTLAVTRIRRALCDRRVELRLVLDGPRLLTVAPVATGQ